MVERNPFDQFDTAPPGVDPVAPAQGANPFDQFNGQPAGVVPPPVAAPAQESPLNAAIGRPPAPQEMVSKAIELGRQGLEKIRQSAGNLYSSTFENPMLGAEQKAVPHPERYGQPLSTDLYVGDDGTVSFRDKDGNIVPAENDKHVLLRGPDNRPTIYARTDAQTEAPVFGASRILSLGLGAGAPAQTVAKLPGAVRPSVEPTVQGLKEAAVGSRGVGGVLNDPAILSRPVPTQVVSGAFNEIAPRIRNFDPRVQQEVANELKDLSGGTVADLNHASERLGVLANQTSGPLGNQTATPTAAAAQLVKKQIDKVRDIVAPEMRDADLNYAAAKATETITGRENLATVRARGNEGAFAQKMADQATQLLSNPKYLRGFQPEEIDMLRDISQGRVASGRAQAVAQWLASKVSQLGPIAAGALGFQHGGVGGAVGGTLGALGTMALEPVLNNIIGRFGGKATAEQINALTAAIRNRSPLAQQLRDNALAWDQAWRDIRQTPSSMTLTALARSSRELSNALRAAGVEIRPNLLMRGVEGPGTSQADQNQK